MASLQAGRYALLVAGGSGLRMGAVLPKQFLPLGGRPVLMHTLERFAPLVERIVLVLPEEQRGYWVELCQQHDFTLPHGVTAGGETRFHSVAAGLSLLPEEGLVAVHDGVRPLLSSSRLASRPLRALEQPSQPSPSPTACASCTRGAIAP